MVTAKDGSILQIRWDGEGNVHVLHPDIYPSAWGELREYSKVRPHDRLTSFLIRNGIERSVDGQIEGKIARKMGAYLILEQEIFLIDRKEADSIYAAVRKNGGIVRDWPVPPDD